MGTYIPDFRQGDTKIIKVDYGIGYDITGWVFYFVMKLDADSRNADVLISTTVGDNTLDDALNGLVHITLDSNISKALKPGSYLYSVKRSKGGIPEDIQTVLPPIDESQDRIRVVEALTLV